MDSSCSYISDDLGSGCVLLTLRARRPEPLVQDEQDWQALALTAKRMAFWCGAVLYGCRCEARVLRVAMELGRSPIGAAARLLCVAYGNYLRRRRGWHGPVFCRYSVLPVDGDLFLDDLVLWLHRRESAGAQTSVCWTADSAYVRPGSCDWISTRRVLAALSPGAGGRSAYLRRRAQAPAPEVIARLLGSRGRHHPRAQAHAPSSLDKIARFVAAHTGIGHDARRPPIRDRALARTRALITVLAVRDGASVAAVARFLGRSRSTLIEQADRLRDIHPEVFIQAERALRESVAPQHPFQQCKPGAGKAAVAADLR